MQVTETVVLAVTGVEVSEMPEVEGKASVAALMVHAAVTVSVTFRFAVAVPAAASVGRKERPPKAIAMAANSGKI